MFHEIILEILEMKIKESTRRNYYFKSKIINKREKPSDFINDYKYNKYIKSEDIKQIQISGIFNTPEDIDEYVKIYFLVHLEYGAILSLNHLIFK